jgi:hypothetical protein
MLKLITLSLATFLTLNSYALGNGGIRLGNGIVRITPVVTYEQQQKNYPTSHTKNVLSYGVGIEIGPPAFSIEIRGTQSDDTSDYTSPNEKVEEKIQKLSLGLKSYVALNSVFRFYFRAGAQGKKIEQTITDKSTLLSTTTKSAFYVDPYAGTGININLANVFSMNLGINATLSDYPNDGKIEYSTTFGLGMGF